MEQFEKVLETVEDKAKHFTKITAEDREKVKNWVTKQKGKTEKEKCFLVRARQAIKTVKYDYWIATLEASVSNGKIYYAERNDVGVGFSGEQWTQMANEYAPERGSRLSNLHELFIWYALRIVNGLWALDYIANKSSFAGKDYDAFINSHYSMNKTGERVCGGYRDGQGNNHKIVTHESGYMLVGGHWNNISDYCPMLDSNCVNNPFFNATNYRTGVVVLTK